MRAPDRGATRPPTLDRSGFRDGLLLGPLAGALAVLLLLETGGDLAVRGPAASALPAVVFLLAGAVSRTSRRRQWSRAAGALVGAVLLWGVMVGGITALAAPLSDPRPPS